jgi:hypothetical protein
MSGVGRRSRRRTGRLRATGAAVLALLLAFGGVAGCGGRDPGDGVATAGGTATPTSSAAADGRSAKDTMVEYAKCMRENGIANFPDPDVGDGGEIRLELPDGADPQKVDAAQQKCQQYLPNGGEPQKLDPQQLEQQRQMSRCMRENGVPNFPDPDEYGRIKVEGGPGLDPQSPEFKAAEEACAKYRPAPPSGAPGAGPQTRTNS